MGDISTKPYLIRAIHEWCTDSGYRPYIAVMVDEGTQVPREFVRGGEIVLNVSVAATNRLVIGNDTIDFEARFGGVARAVSIPVANVSAIYAQETGHGMAFDVPKPPAAIQSDRISDPVVTVASGPAQAEADLVTGPSPGAAGRKRSRPTLVPVSPADDAGTGSSGAAGPTSPEGKPARKSRSSASRPRKTPGRPELVSAQPPAAGDDGKPGPTDPSPRPPGGKPSLTRVK